MTDEADKGLRTMLDLVAAMPDQLEETARLGGLGSIEAPECAPRRLLLCGMGGSAIAGDLLRPWLEAHGVDLRVHRDYGLPAWVDASVTVVGSSYSGNTEETLSGIGEARRRGCPVVGLCSGGDVAVACAAAGETVVRLPGGLPPRAALGYSLGALAQTVHRLGAAPDPTAELTAAAVLLRAGNETNSPTQRRAREVAAAADGCYVVIYTTSAEAHAAGARLKGQLNENAKVPAACAALPELDHNDIVGWQDAPGGASMYLLLVLRGGDEHERIARRVGITLEVLEGQFGAVEELRATGETPLARTLSLVQVGDLMSCRLAGLRGVDPVPVRRIDRLKEELAKGTNQ